MTVQRSWWKKIVPVRVRHNMKLILGSALVLVLVGGFLGSFPLQPIVFSNGNSTLTSEIVNNIEGNIDLFDYTQPHSITFELDQLEYDFMQSEFIEFGEKAWVQVTAVIDGIEIDAVGIRLKGNSTLGALGGGGDAFSMEKVMGDNFALPEGMEGGMMSSIVTFDDISTLPLLVSFNEFVPGRGYQGHTQIALRYGDAGVANLNEGLALQLIEDSGQVSQKYTWVSYSINGSDTVTRIVVENPSQDYVTGLGIGSGVMYKSRSSNTFTYHGEDQSQYVEDFLQLNAWGSQDMTPVIKLLGWLESATDEEFDAELGDWVDVPSFAKYVVTHDLLNNFDDMAGPGKNFLLWYDLEVEKFTVMTWDVNLAISGQNMGAMAAFLPEGMTNIGDLMEAMSNGELDMASLIQDIMGKMMAQGGDMPEGFPALPEGVDMAAMMANMPEGAMPEGFPAPPEGVDMAAMMANMPEGAMPEGFPALPEGVDMAAMMANMPEGAMPEGFPALPEGVDMAAMMANMPEGAMPEGFPALPEGVDMAAMMENMPEGAMPPGFPAMPEGLDMSAMMENMGEGGGLPGITFGNTLKDRFTESEVFADIIESTREELLEFWFTSGLAMERLNELAQFAPVTDKLSQEQIQAEIATLTEAIAQVK